jgi:hypothetical protein
MLMALVGCVQPNDFPVDASSTADGRAGTGGHSGAGGGTAGSPSSEAGAAGSDAAEATPEGGAGSSSAQPDGSAGTGDSSVDLATDIVDAPSITPDASSAGKNNGLACGGGSECTSGKCVEGVCCDNACGSKCSSCLAANTGKLDGQCAPVKAGQSHGADCTASEPTSCGLNGKCDGSGACQKFVAGTMCAPEACSDGASTSTYAPVRTCDGKGACSASVSTNCGGTYRCAGTKCNVNCGSDSQCAPSAFCSATACMAKKADGALCSANGECIQGSCSGRCCLGCKCTQPSAANVLKNPGFDLDINGWTLLDATTNSTLRGTDWTQFSDEESCPYSGAIVVTLPAANTSGVLRQCASNLNLDGNYNFGIRGFVIGDGVAICGVRFYPSSDCSGSQLVDDELNAIAGNAWQAPAPETSIPSVSVSGAHSVLFFCSVGGTSSYYFDRAYVSKIPATY